MALAIIVFGQFASEAFDHGDGVARAGHDEVEIALFHLRVRRHDDEFAVDAADADGGRRLQKRNRRDVQGGAGADHRQHVGIVLLVGGQDVGHHLHFVEIAGGEERTDGPVDQPRGQDFLGGRPAFALDVAAREFAGGGGFFAVLDAQGEEVDAFAGIAGDGGDQRHRVADADDNGSMCLFC